MKVVLTRQIPEAPLKLLKEHFEVDHYDQGSAIPRKLLLSKVKAADALLPLLTEKIDDELLRAAPKLRMVASFSVGLDHVDLKACTARGVPVTHTPGVLTESCADFAFALMLDAGRRVAEGDRMMRAGRYKGWDPLMLLGVDLHGSTLGIVGFGRIGQAVARRALGFGMRILYYDAHPMPDAITVPLKAAYAGLPELLRESDFVTLHTVLDETTRHLIGEKELRSMKRTAVLVNSARGPIVDEAALVKALKGGWIRGAGLDVYEREPKMAPGLAKLPNAVLAPHLASATQGTRNEMGRLAVQSLIDYLVHGRTPKNLANPEVLKAPAVPS
jgi:glyoxylate reductase